MDDGQEGRRDLQEDDEDGDGVVKRARLQDGESQAQRAGITVHGWVLRGVDIDAAVILVNRQGAEGVGRLLLGIGPHGVPPQRLQGHLAVHCRAIGRSGVSYMAVGGRERGHGWSWEGVGRSGVAIEMAVALLLLHPLARTYETTLMPGIPLIRSTLLSLGCGRSTRHATLLTQSDFRVSAVGAGGTSAGPQTQSCRWCVIDGESHGAGIVDGPDLMGDRVACEGGERCEGAAW